MLGLIRKSDSFGKTSYFTIVGAKVAYKDMINKEYWVDEYLKKMES